VVKRAVRDVDHTLLDGVFLRRTRAAGADPAMVACCRAVRAGILHAIASRNPPAVAAYGPVTGAAFVAAEAAGTPSDAIGRIADTLELDRRDRVRGR
jgi:hypothetical protein